MHLVFWVEQHCKGLDPSIPNEFTQTFLIFRILELCKNLMLCLSVDSKSILTRIKKFCRDNFKFKFSLLIFHFLCNWLLDRIKSVLIKPYCKDFQTLTICTWDLNNWIIKSFWTILKISITHSICSWSWVLRLDQTCSGSILPGR